MTYKYTFMPEYDTDKIYEQFYTDTPLDALECAELIARIEHNNGGEMILMDEEVVTGEVGREGLF